MVESLRGSRAVLKLKKVELLGFKSFPERTELRFNGGGIAAVVGPNGCGKSNLSDAISWVLGEQSARLLRGTRMEDVIFNGTRDRKPLGMAAVTLTLIDPEAYFYSSTAGNAPEGSQKPGEILVTRRLFRSGESEYLLNGRGCRLRDIQEIFMGTGLGPESYAIIEQGRIGQILSSRPYDRRALVEEAAGITKFKTRKKLAEAKLESATQNLSRVADILEEVGRQANSLKRQAAKTRRAQELKQEMTSRLALVLGGRHQDLERQAVAATVDLSLASDQLRQRTTEVDDQEAEHDRLQKEGHQLEQDLEQARESLSSAAVETERARQKVDYQRLSAEENDGRVLQTQGELEAVERRIEELAEEMDRERSAATAVETEAGEARDQLSAKTAELDLRQLQIQQRELRQELLRQMVLRALGEASGLRNQLAQVEEFLAGQQRQSQRAEAEEIQAGQELTQLTGEREAQLGRLQQQQMELESLEERRQRMEAGLAASKSEAQARRERAESLRDEISRLEARRESLEEILSHRAYTTETVKNLFAAIEQGRLGDFRARGILADFVEVDAQYEKAVEEFLREELEYIVVESWAEAERGMRLLRAEMEGHATFLLHPEGAPEPPHGPTPESGLVGRLADCLRLSNGLGASAAAALLPRLARCYLAENEDAARRLAGQYPDLYFLLPDGLCYHGFTLSGGRKTSSGPLALKRELREMAPRLTTTRAALEAETIGLAQAEEAIARQTEGLEALRGELQDREKSTLASEHELRQIHDRLNRTNALLSMARLEIERLKEETARATAEQQQCQAGAEQWETARSQAEEALTMLRAALAEDQARTARLAEEQAACRAQLAALEERHKAALAAAARLEQTLGGETARRDEMARQVGAWAAERDRLLEDNSRLAVAIEQLATRQAELEQRASDLETSLHQRRARVTELEELLKMARQELDAAREKRSAIEIELVRLQSDLKHLEQTCVHELGRPVAELAAGGEPLTPEQLAEAEQDYLRIKEKYEALGPVNPLALEEYQEAQQRFDFLEAQRQDLVDSIRDTQQAIKEIDAVSRKQFLAAFEQINQNFRQTFATLFGGGSGEMRLTDETNVADSGVDIVAQPPGKRLQNVLLLSGGEKALTAIALLMAVFQYQPSPFCILDEVDAPLDEANIQRFTRLIREMSDQTQFILITHSKTTMEVAQTLYGVTMQEPGVSRLVSVKFETPREEPPPPPVVVAAAPVGNLARA